MIKKGGRGKITYLCLPFLAFRLKKKKKGFYQSCAESGFVGQNCSWQNTTSLETFLLFSGSRNSREGCLSSVYSFILPHGLKLDGWPDPQALKGAREIKNPHLRVSLLS